MLAEWEERVRSGEVAGRAMRAQAEVEGEALRMGLWAVLDGAAPWVGVAVDGDRAEVRWSGVEETGFGEALIAGFEAFEVGMRERMAGAVREAEAAALRGEEWRAAGVDAAEFELGNTISSTSDMPDGLPADRAAGDRMVVGSF